LCIFVASMLFKMNLKQIPTQKLVLPSFLAFLFLVLVVSFAIRGFVLRKAIASINARIKSHQFSAHWDDARFKGLNTVLVKGIYVQSKKGGDELFMDSVSLRVRILPLFLKNIRIREFECRTISIRYHAEKKVFKKVIEKTDDTTGMLDLFRGKDLADLANKNIRRLFGYAPAKTRINRIQIRISSAGTPTLIGIHGLLLLHGKMTAKLVFAGEESRVEIPIEGRFDKYSSVIELHLANADTSMLPIPLLREKYGISAGFDSLSLTLNLSNHSRHMTSIEGTFNFAGFELNGERLSTSSIEIDHFRSTFHIRVGSATIELDSSTQAYLNRIMIKPYFRISLAHDPEIQLKLLPVSWDANDFFSSLPRGMFTSLVGLKAKGTLHYYLDFAVNWNNPDSLLFNTGLTADNFNIVEFGADDYRMINGSFYHKVYEHGQLIAAFMIGPENPDYTAFMQISPFLRAAVMTSEDGSFFYHNGFNVNAFRESIAANIKEKRFARGGSTISMQLVKNVFLTRNKTLARKIEEALIVWLIESKNLVSKQRMYEVYLNMIEWGPGIYGINQASRFYFNKTPFELNLQESVYLASIVPHPKWYKYTFETNGIVKPFFGNYFNRLKELMVRKEFIASGDTDGVSPVVLLTGPAAKVFTESDTTAADSVLMDELEIIRSL